MNIGIFVFNQVEVLDFAGPYEVFTTASRVQRRQDLNAPAVFEVCLIAEQTESVKARAGLVVQPDCTITHHPALDVLIIPGGVVSVELENRAVVEWIRAQAQSVPLLASVCTGAFLLAEAGLLANKRATTHWEDIFDLHSMYPAVQVIEGQRWVDEGDVVTSAGISAGIDMSLHLVERCYSRGLAESTARQMEFDWTENPPMLLHTG